MFLQYLKNVRNDAIKEMKDRENELADLENTKKFVEIMEELTKDLSEMEGIKSKLNVNVNFSGSVAIAHQLQKQFYNVLSFRRIGNSGFVFQISYEFEGVQTIEVTDVYETKSAILEALETPLMKQRLLSWVIE
jgi:hypothetical protein